MGSLLAGAALLVAFCVVELAQKSPLLPLGIFRSAQFSGANAVTFVVYAGLGGALFLLPIQLQTVLGFSPLEAGISLLPITVIMLALSARSGALAARIGPRLQMSAGPLFVAAGLALLARVGVTDRYVPGVLPALVVLGFGLAATVAPLTAAVLAAAPSEHSGVASAVNNDVARVGSLVAVAVLPSLAGITGKSYLHPAEFSAGFHNAVLIAAGRLCSGFSHRRPHHPQPCASAKTGGAKTRVGSRMAMRARRPGAVPPQGEAEAGQWGTAAHSAGLSGPAERHNAGRERGRTASSRR